MTCRETVAPQWRERLAACGLKQLGSLLDDTTEVSRFAGRWENLGKPGLGGRRRWRWQWQDGAGDVVLYVKRYAGTPLGEQWDRIRRQNVRHSRAYWEFVQSQRLGEAHIRVPPAVGFVEQMRGTFERRSALLLEGVPGDGCDRVWRRLCEQRAPVTRGIARHDLAVRLARFVAAFHGTGFCHRDLYLCHIFVDLDPQGGQPPRFALIDLARTHRPRFRRMRWIIKDLSQLDASACQSGATRSDRWRFLLAYLNLQPGAPRARWYARRIVRKSEKILRRAARKSQQT
ncbi:MAG: lipopolysaccharide kinase InaA family protein [Phycisphaerae bacterium]